MSLTNFAQLALDYANRVTNDEIPACLYIHQACQRFIDDLEREDITLDADAAQKWCEFLEKMPHVKGKWAAKHETLKLSDWQIFATANIFGWKLPNGMRRFRDVHIEVGRKNGKSFWLGAIGLGMLCIDDEFAAEIYCGATTEKQAWEIFRPARLICKAKPALVQKYGIEVNAKTLVTLGNGSRFEPVIGDPPDGASPSLGIADEYHEHKTSNLVDTFVTGMGAREQPLMFKITTAGFDTGSPCYESRADLINILKGTIVDDSVFGLIYTIDEDDEWDTEEALIKANPNLGISISKDFLLGQLAQAKRSATKQVSYKTKHLNQWVGAKAAWMNMLSYQVCRKNLDIDLLKGEQCYVGIDLASKVDIASMAIYFPETSQVFMKHYLPEERVLEGGNTRYKAWHADGWLTTTEGNVTDFAYIEEDLKELKSKFEIIEVPYDPFQATQFSVRMMDEGFPMVEYGATVKNFSEPMKELEALILKKAISFEKDPVLMWMFGNVTARLDLKDNIFPNKERPENKIDGVVALIMALARHMANNKQSDPYSERGIISV